MVSLSFARATSPAFGDLTAYVAIRTSYLDDALGSIDGFTFTPCALDLPEAVKAMLTDELSAEARDTFAVIGVTVNGTWITGPFSGQHGPESN